MRNDESLVATWALDFRALKGRGGRDSLVAGWALENNVCHRGKVSVGDAVAKGKGGRRTRRESRVREIERFLYFLENIF